MADRAIANNYPDGQQLEIIADKNGKILCHYINQVFICCCWYDYRESFKLIH